jgi:hypothetical protein
MRVPLLCVAMGAVLTVGNWSAIGAEPSGEVVVENPYGGAGRGVFYESKAHHTQRVNLKRVRVVEVHCYCPERYVEKTDDESTVKLSIDGRFKISGYHGSREDAGAEPLQSRALAFKVGERGSAITLSSPEWRYIHHSLIISRVVVSAPQNVEVVFKPLDDEMLRERGMR